MPGRPKDIEHHQVDLRSKKARDVFRAGDVDALIHLGVMHDPRARPAELYSWNITGTTKLLEYCQAYRVPKVVLLSSANVYGPRPDNPQFLTEDAPLLAAQRFPQMRDLVEIDHLVSTFLWRAQDVETVILRPVHIVGPVHNAPVELPAHRAAADPARLRSDGAADPRRRTWPRRSSRALAPGRRGIYNLVGPGEVPLSVVLAGARPRAASRSRTRWPARSCRSRSGSGCRASRSPSSTSSATSAWSTAGAPRPSSGSARSFGLRETIHAVEELA